ncbi:MULTISPECIES: amino acid ABC transporter substrate-binding protein [unclassified Methylobacterium]|uniref:amino acid ABC transporter substrate-binding protein n=1 Tax=unclassified Methylobacterium TaxID=2615210 RepID=UPI00226A95E3|nr:MULTISPECIES: amino acid ABC transporter substrate-binding protein [unclassified Methylobacterium]
MRVVAPALALCAVLLAARSLPAAAQVADTALHRIQETKTLTIGFRESAEPFAFLDGSQQPSGYSVELCRRVAGALAQALKIDEIRTRFVPVTPQTRIPLIANGTVDVECGTTVNSLGRQQQVDFSYAVALSEGKLLVRKESGIRDLPDLGGKVIALAAGTTADRYVRAALEARKLTARILTVRDNGEGLLAVASQRADAFINDAVLLGGVVRTATEPDRFAVVGTPLSFEQVAFMVGKNNSGLLTVINGVIARLAQSGELQGLYGRWVTPYAGPIDADTAALFKIEGIPE